MTIPTYREASDRRCEGQATAMDLFITQWQPTPPEADDFRSDLQAAIKEIDSSHNRLQVTTIVLWFLSLILVEMLQ